MAEYLVMRIAVDAGSTVHWIAVDSSGARRSQPASGTLEEASAQVGERKVIVLVPSTEVLTTSADVPIKGGTRLQTALPYALEEFLADDVDKLHFAAGARRSSGRLPVSVVSREKLTGWLTRLSDAGIKPASMIAENYGLARIPGTISLLVAENQIVINDGADIELVMQDVSPGDALAAIGALDDNRGNADADRTAGVLPMPRHVLVYCEPEDDERYRHDWIAIRHEMESLDVNLLPDGVMPRLAVTVATGAGINLLQGGFADRVHYSGLFQPWKYAAMLLVGLVAVGVVAKAANLYALHKQESSLSERFMAEYRQIAPGAPEVDDPSAIVGSLRARTGRAETPQVFLQSLEHLSRALRENREARIDAISYRAGVVDIRVTAPNVATLDNIQRSIGESGRFVASIQSTDQEGERVSSRMQIQAGGA
ncbi:MAG: type II secretion system protein GspL [Woeseiaceae bacterium]